MKLDILKLDASKSGKIDLAEDIFGLEVRRDVLHRMVNWQLAKRRAGTHKVKEKSEVSATTKNSCVRRVVAVHVTVPVKPHSSVVVVPCTVRAFATTHTI